MTKRHKHESDVSDHSDAELDELEPFTQRKRETGMNEVTQQEVPETKAYKVTGPINIKGEVYDAGDVIHVTEEEYATLTAVGAPLEGVEAKTPEEVQAAHDEGVEAQKAKIEENAEAERQKEELLKKQKEEREAAEAAPKV
jgi:hypothetical protein